MTAGPVAIILPQMRLHNTASSVAYLGFHFGGVQNIFVKVGVFAWRRVARLLGGSGACSPKKIFKKGAIWCVLENILLKFCKKIIVKIFIFSSFFFFRKNYLLLSCATSVRPSVCGNNFFSR